MIQVPVCWSCQFQGPEANVVQSLVVDAVSLVGVLNELMDGQSGVVGFHDGVRYLKKKEKKNNNRKSLL